NFGFDHPEFREVPARVAIFRPEGRSEGIYLTQGQRTQFCSELSGNGQIGFTAEKILAVIHLTFFGTRWMVRVQGRHPKHFPGPFRIGGRDDGGMEVVKLPLMKKLMDRISQFVADTEYRSEGVGPESEMSVLTEKSLAALIGFVE